MNHVEIPNWPFSALPRKALVYACVFIMLNEFRSASGLCKELLCWVRHFSLKLLKSLKLSIDNTENDDPVRVFSVNSSKYTNGRDHPSRLLFNFDQQSIAVVPFTTSCS